MTGVTSTTAAYPEVKDGPASLPEARDALERLGGALDEALRLAGPEPSQPRAFALAIAAAKREAARCAVAAAADSAGRLESALALAFAREVLAEGVPPAGAGPRGALSEEPLAAEIVGLLESAPAGPPRGLSGELAAVAETFRRFAREVVEPHAERIHREDLLVPEDIVTGLRALGAFGLSIPVEHGGIHTGDGEGDLAMVVATEELSRASMAAAGGLTTRPEIVAKVVLEGGTEDQKRRWLPRIASGEDMVAVAVTEPGVGSDVAGCRLQAVEDPDGGFRLTGTKTWCTFAGYADKLLCLARTEPEASPAHRGLSLFLVDKPRSLGRAFVCEDGRGGRLEGRAIDTLGYRGMHSFEVSFDRYAVPADALIGGEAGRGRGFYLMMHGFAGGRLQTAARAVGLMEAAFERALGYARERSVFGRRSIDWPLTQHKLARMAAVLYAARQATYAAARRGLGGAGASLAASMVKLFACREAEWLTREAQQIHGGMGYAEEFAVSRYFVDARVLSIFEGAEEVLALRVVVPALLQRANEAREREDR